MSTTELIVRLVSGALLTAMNAFFVTTEFSLTRLRQLPEERFRDDPRLRRAWEMTEELEIYLTGCQLGITSSSILLGVVAEPAVSALLHPAWNGLGLSGGSAATASVVTAVVAINLIHKIWGEQAPTYLGVERPVQVARWAAGPHYWWTRIMYPVIKLGDGAAKLTLRAIGVEMSRSWVENDDEADPDPSTTEGTRDPARRAEGGRTTRSDLLGQMGEVLSRGGVAPDRRREVMKALEIQRIPARDIMVPADEVVALDVELSLEENLERIRDAPHSRFPLVRGPGLERYVGTIYAQALLLALDPIRQGSTSLEEVAAEPVEVSPDLPVAYLIDHLQERGQELAIVREDERVLGLVTVTDALEVITGELTDPLDEA